MKKTTFLILSLIIYNFSFTQIKTVAATYKVSYVKLDNGIILNIKNKDSIITIKNEAVLNGIKNGGEPVSKQDSVDVNNTNTSFINNIMSLTLVLKADGKYNKLINTSGKNKMETLETGTYTYNVKTNLIKFKPKIKDEKNQNQIVKYNATNKTINLIAGENEEDAGEVIVQFKKIIN